ncbi:MAG TPA: ABC transporter ATP-binding protein [Pirellulales bacterium]|jgi:lipoprotein-releasing system ATP-binding protein|nr:ABC transporter ATP-binding protein [Pirellulales bacterium]
MPTLVVENITKEYLGRGRPLVVLRGCSLELARGENLAIVGPSGSGKSTLLSIIGTLDRPSSGCVSLDGRDPFALNDRELAAFRNEQIGFVFQDHHLLPQCTVLENVLIPTLAAGPAKAEAIDRAHQLLERVGLADRLQHLPAELSGGERQRVALARALVRRPLVVLADEPTGNLDRTTAAGVSELLLELQREEQTVLVVVTHSDELAGRMQRQIELDDGRLVPRTVPQPLGARTPG